MSFIDDLKWQYRTGGAVIQIIYWNVILFALPLVVQSLLILFNIKFTYIEWVSISSNPEELLHKPWSIITYAFFHSDFLHLIFNMITLHFVGVIFHTFFTQKQFITLYFLGIIFSAFLYILSYFILPALLNHVVPMVGASGAIMAVLMAVATYSPQSPVRLLLIGNVKLWQIALVFIVLDIIQLPYQNTGGHLAHLGGAFFGYLYIVLLKNGVDLSKMIGNIEEKVKKAFLPKKKNPFVKVHKNESSTTTQKVFRKDKTQQQIDDILDKISKSGYDSLSKEEKEFLFKASK